ncbi:MAG: hypothetical protein AAGK37_11060 [Pseudomonadota bacterium]
MSETSIGLSQRELEYEVDWHMRSAPSDPGKLQDYLNNLVVKLIVKNNAAIAARLAERDRTDLPEGG